MAGVIGPHVHPLPSQLPIVEWGMTDGSGMPAALEVFTSGWFDTWRVAPEDVINGDGSVIVNTQDPGAFAPGSNRRAGVYVLDLFVRHNNPALLALEIQKDEIPAPALVGLPFAAFVPREVIVVPASNGTNDVYLSRTFRVRNRMIRLGFTYPNSTPNDWYFSALLRSA